jgi:hypothetical protein
VEWSCNRVGGEVLSRKSLGRGLYDYRIGSSREDSRLVWVARADAARLDGCDVEQEPWYPYPEEPWRPGLRAQRAFAERLDD